METKKDNDGPRTHWEAESFPLEVQRGQDTCPGSRCGAGAPRSLVTEGRSPHV